MKKIAVPLKQKHENSKIRSGLNIPGCRALSTYPPIVQSWRKTTDNIFSINLNTRCLVRKFP